MATKQVRFRFPPKPPKASAKPRKVRRKRSDHRAYREVLDALASIPTATPSKELLSTALEALGTPRTRAALAEILENMERRGWVEIWPDQDRPGVIRVMLSAGAIRRLNLALDPLGKGWRVVGPAICRGTRRIPQVAEASID